MSNTNGRSPITVVSPNIKYDLALSNRRHLSTITAVILISIIVVVCGCLACSTVNWVSSFLSQLLAN